ncbi:restriction endonuclease [Yersinia kristensenii]|uniref:restriction endonuclease n=1 Tax=Yersinia kristensenii TaxID=28152 RepID=UPI000C15C239|nr:restriction endonuclease [Yersinia kristensenii]MBW5825259.1 restriction endonuclease [Yersinia kristensenii]MDA5473278.1 restriction endonuclease [Yersinia kristensenii]MDA5475610.1 restriction endonuclease [Yersinia kristensenii]MDA5507094.1 restriction endonuclease [Yersinia kristensenii]MDA5523285.1 restriction endonuclease [Yersinia kristensenii]
MDLLSLSPTNFENLTFDVITTLGLRNSVWRTPGSDLGRDIEGDYFISDLSGQYQRQKWYIECKRYTSSVDWPTIWNKIAYAETHVADVLLFVTSSSLSPQAVDHVRLWNNANKKPTIRFWGAVELCAKLNLHPQIAKKYGLKSKTDSNLEAFIPSIDLLLRITNSLSPEIDEASQAKLWLLHSFSELISKRILDVKTGYGFGFREHTEIDYFDWIDITKVNLLAFDKYSTRVILAYLFFVLKEEPEIIQKSPRLIHLALPRELIESEVNHIRIISELSNYTMIIKQKNITLELI